eukprot:CAMPEP_0206462456 /NCGR_PEP_ID=MMETSP0324_2-20121206/25992_1 /ASSEMBLY_ACC=CAM_ASM_000836 /TAXON_ID=2866 /ORGANISM="Crypthecodinium cohnii, Strain Seligo" /LENGTH=157 /DNA_ID=CAMNT_0053934621 /DNA_START=106 /DNA_END=576 /DNA_ORIENTATION=-
MADDLDEEEEEVKATGQGAAEAKQLDSLTDFHDEDKAGANFDTKAAEARLTELRKKKEETDKLLAEKEKKLASVKVKKEDLDALCSELPLCDKDALERVLRENDGNLVEAMRAAARKFPMGPVVESGPGGRLNHTSEGGNENLLRVVLLASGQSAEL